MSYSNHVAIIGDGGHARSLLDVCRSVATYSISLGGSIRPGRCVPDSRQMTAEGWRRLATDYNRYLLGVGQIKYDTTRKQLYGLLDSLGMAPITLISPDASVSQQAYIRPGAQIMRRVVVNANAAIGANTIINSGAIVEHDCTIGPHCHVCPGATISGGATVGEMCFIGANSTVLNGITIGNQVVLGAGGVAVTDLTRPGLYLGNPAAFIKELPDAASRDCCGGGV